MGVLVLNRLQPHTESQLSTEMLSKCQLVGIVLLGLCFQCGSTRSAVKYEDSTGEWSNGRPIIGILTQEFKERPGTGYIPASYVKFLEGGGARVVPIKINQTDEYYTTVFASINGVLFPGGNQDLFNSDYVRTATKLYNMAIAANDQGDYFPVWGTCLGFEFLSVIASGQNYLSLCDAHEKALPLDFEPVAKTSLMFGNAPKDVLNILANQSYSAHFHYKCLSVKKYAGSEKLVDFFNVLATCMAPLAGRFVSAMEAKNYPIWGTQFHAEKNLYEWLKPSLLHSSDAIKASQYFARFFVDEARKSHHNFSSPIEENKYLIYNYHPEFTGLEESPDFEQLYFIDI